jgi:putative transposase
VNQILPLSVSAYVSIVPNEAMKYKEQIKENELITKIRIIRFVKKEHLPVVAVAKSFSMHRNTIGKMIKAFEKIITPEDQSLLLCPGAQATSDELMQRYQNMLNKKRIPKTHKRSAPLKTEKAIVTLFTKKNIKVGVVQMKLILNRRFGENVGLAKLSIGQLKGIYKRNNLKTAIVRSANGERRHLYDYQAIACFAFMHLDVKHILDKHALPQDIYDLLSTNGAPIYEWNLIDAKSRTRFTAYSYGLCAEFGFRFLLFAIQYIRATLGNHGQHIRIGMDNGLEFCLGSQKKEDEWNRVLSVLNASVYQYDPHFDIRKNLIERSHKTDDEALYIPRGIFMKDKYSFHQEVISYQDYWNKQRPHTGIGMNNRTPQEVLIQQGLIGVNRLLNFPVLILEDSILQLRKCNGVVEFEAYALQNPEIIQKAVTCQKTRRIIEDRFYFPFNAHNVLTYYHGRGSKALSLLVLANTYHANVFMYWLYYVFGLPSFLIFNCRF